MALNRKEKRTCLKVINDKKMMAQLMKANANALATAEKLSNKANTLEEWVSKSILLLPYSFEQSEELKQELFNLIGKYIILEDNNNENSNDRE